MRTHLVSFLRCRLSSIFLSAVWDGHGPRRKLVLALAILALLLPAAIAKSPKIGKDLDTNKDAEVDVIVQYRVEPTTTHLQKAAIYTVPASALEDLANDPDVKFVSPNRAVYGAATGAVSMAGGTSLVWGNNSSTFSLGAGEN